MTDRALDPIFSPRSIAVVGASRRRDVEVRRVREVSFTGPAGSPAQVDGDVCPERLPLRVRIAPERLLVLAPGPAPGEAP